MAASMKQAFNWDDNPFSFKILPEHFVGYTTELNSLITGVSNGDKFSLLLGPTGSGKTTLLQYISNRFPSHHVMYLPKPPKDSQDWLTVFHDFTRPGALWRLLRRGNGLTLYTLSGHLNRKLNGTKCLLFVDECHEASQDSLEWLRTITDQVENLSIVLAGLPVFENNLKDTLETFLRRFTVQVDLGCLSKAETREFMKRRIESCGGDDIKPFTPAVIDHIYEKTGGFPREILRVCNELVQRSLEKDLTTIDTDLLTEADIPSRATRDVLDALPSKQRLIIDILGKEGQLTPTEIVEKIQAKGEYKDQENAIRAVNNLVRRLLSDGLVERKKFGKGYRYQVSPRYQTLLVEA